MDEYDRINIRAYMDLVNVRLDEEDYRDAVRWVESIKAYIISSSNRSVSDAGSK